MADTNIPTGGAAAGAAGGADPVSAIAKAIGEIANMTGKLFDLAGMALKPGLLATQAYFQQLLNAAPKLQDPYADANANRRRMNMILVGGGLLVIVLLIVVVIIKKRAQK